MTLTTTTTLCLIGVFLGCVQSQDCSCTDNSGNVYSAITNDSCTSFQVTEIVMNKTTVFRCPAGLKFSVEKCMCDHPNTVDCGNCDTPVCENLLNEEFESQMAMGRAGKCAEARARRGEILSNCVVKDPVARIRVTMRYMATNRRYNNCGAGNHEVTPHNACSFVTTCMGMLLHPDIYESDDAWSTVRLLCENADESLKCLKCANDKGCPIAGQYHNTLQQAVVEMCPYTEKFDCPVEDEA